MKEDKMYFRYNPTLIGGSGGVIFFSSLVSVHAQPFTQGDYLSLNMLTLRLHTSLKDTIQ